MKRILCLLLIGITCSFHAMAVIAEAAVYTDNNRVFEFQRLCFSSNLQSGFAKHQYPWVYAHKDIKNLHVSIEGHKIYYDMIGHSDKYIVLLHGLFGNSGVWHKMMPSLANDGYTVIAPDLPGYGWSQGFPLYDYTLRRQTFLVHEFLQKIGIKKFNIGGNSFGGTIAILYTETYPDEIKSIAFLGSPGGVAGFSEAFKDIIKTGHNPLIPMTEKEFKDEMNLLFVKSPYVSKSFIDKKISSYRHKRFFYRAVWDIAAAELYDFTIENKMDIKCPALIIWGKEDKIFSSDGAYRLHKEIPGSKLIVLPDAGHLLAMEFPGKTVQLYIKFLSRTN